VNLFLIYLIIVRKKREKEKFIYIINKSQYKKKRVVFFKYENREKIRRIKMIKKVIIRSEFQCYNLIGMCSKLLNWKIAFRVCSYPKRPQDHQDRKCYICLLDHCPLVYKHIFV
jgi:hypothetical protein